MIEQTMVTTNIELNGYRVTKNLGVVRGITVRSRSLLGNIAGGLKRCLAERFLFMLSYAKKQERKLSSKWSNMLLNGERMQLYACVMMPMKLLTV